ncbi:hypothetical protein, partial [Candidatus Avelusimicrobium alvi]|uniref:hypothetical protein n=1 Tax=Candidatus Avelusimicrobium alvi TaxID=3416221 RepID=UPI003D0D061E
YARGYDPIGLSPIYQKKKNNTSLLYLSSFISKRSKKLYFLFLTAKKEQKDCRPVPIKSSSTRRVLQLASLRQIKRFSRVKRIL